LATFAINGVSRIGVVPDADPDLLIDVSSAEGTPSDLMAVVAGGDSVRRSLDRLRTSALDAPGRIVRVNDVWLRPPLSRPGKLLCLAGNYRKLLHQLSRLRVHPAALVAPLLLVAAQHLRGIGRAHRRFATQLLGFSNEQDYAFWEGFLLLFGLGAATSVIVSLMTRPESIETCGNFTAAAGRLACGDRSWPGSQKRHDAGFAVRPPEISSTASSVLRLPPRASWPS
jgi:hypothetical protein